MNTIPPIEVERELFALVKRERRARDICDWELMAALYWPGAIVHVTWFEGTAEEFIAVSAGEAGVQGVHGRHTINPAWCEVNGDRALVESQGAIEIRPRLDGMACDLTAWCRFLSRAECRGGQWRLTTFDSIYGKDHLAAVFPGETPAIDRAVFEAGRPSYQFLTYINSQSGRPVPQDLPGDDRPDLLAAFYADAREWLELGDAAVEGRWRPKEVAA